MKRERQDYIEALYMDSVAELTRYAISFVGKEVATDIVHDAFLRFLDVYGCSTDRTSSVRILFRIVHNLSLDHLEKVRRRQQAASAILFDSVSLVGEKEAYSYIRQRLEATLRAVERLTPRQRQIIEMRYVKGLTSGQIAQQLELSQRTVENIVYRSLIELRRITAQTMKDQ